MREHLFDCVICQRGVVDYNHSVRNGRDRQLSPICNYCEGEYGERLAGAGAFMDRRLANRLAAISNALHSKASLMTWEAKYGRS